jgi:hypothetical protein
MTINVSSSAALRTAIQNITNVGPIVPAAGSYSVTTLAKTPSNVLEPSVPLINTYTIQGFSRTGTIINNTRIYQSNIDGAFGPRTVDNLTLQYNSSTSNNTAILNATTGSYTLNRLNIQGQHGGWAGNGGVYMALTTSNGNTPINTNLILQRSTISVTGQTGNASFLQSWNNTGTVQIGGAGSGNTFNESGYNRGSFHFASMYPGGTQGTKRGTYTVRDNTFNGSGTTRDNSNRLENVNATLQGNTFNNGSYLDLAGSLSNTSLFNNTFNTISGGQAIRFTQKVTSSGAILDTTGLVLNGTVFNGYGLPIVNNDAAIATPSVVKVTSVGANNIYLPNLGTFSPDVFYAGGRFADTITDTDGTPDWINGGAGDDSIDGGDGDDWIIGGAGNDTITTGINSMDTVLYYDPSEGNDTITDFSDAASMAPDMLAFRSSTFGGLTSGTFIDGTNFISDPAPVAGTNGPTFLYNSLSGQLTYDANGSDPGGTSLIATLSGAPTLAVGDFKFF